MISTLERVASGGGPSARVVPVELLAGLPIEGRPGLGQAGGPDPPHRLERRKLSKSDIPGTPHHPARIFYYFSVHLRIVERPSLLIDVSDQLDAKRAALACYRSQLVDNQAPGRPTVTHSCKSSRGRYPSRAVAIVPAGSGVLRRISPSGCLVKKADEDTKTRSPPGEQINRFWLHHFGRGIVATPADFGAQGERSTHPELLDWLADEFTAGG
ncbi:MAG: DUF1553 domain-containing protein [Planctomycetia bacterium]|nr:DUF1553 domain-containing protein [Planctomycetia bacterium]